MSIAGSLYIYSKLTALRLLLNSSLRASLYRVTFPVALWKPRGRIRKKIENEVCAGSTFFYNVRIEVNQFVNFNFIQKRRQLTTVISHHPKLPRPSFLLIVLIINAKFVLFVYSTQRIFKTNSTVNTLNMRSKYLPDDEYFVYLSCLNRNLDTVRFT